MIETTILNNLIFNEDYTRKVLPFLKENYFSDRQTKLLFKLVDEYIKKYNNVPTKAALTIDAENLTGISDDDVKGLKDFIDKTKEEPAEMDWLLDNTEKFCQDKAIQNAILIR
jgi:hypothetical protein